MIELVIMNENYEKQLFKKIKNDKILCEALYENGKFPYKTFEEFHKTGKNFFKNKNAKTFAIMINKNVVGSISISQKELTICKIGYFIISNYWNKGYTSKAFQKAMKIAKEEGYNKATAKIKSDNIASLKIWEKYNPIKSHIANKYFKMEIKL